MRTPTSAPQTSSKSSEAAVITRRINISPARNICVSRPSSRRITLVPLRVPAAMKASPLRRGRMLVRLGKPDKTDLAAVSQANVPGEERGRSGSRGKQLSRALRVSEYGRVSTTVDGFRVRDVVRIPLFVRECVHPGPAKGDRKGN